MRLLVGKIGNDEVTYDVDTKSKPNISSFLLSGEWHTIGFDGQIAWYTKNPPNTANITQ